MNRSFVLDKRMRRVCEFKGMMGMMDCGNRSLVYRLVDEWMGVGQRCC